MKLHGNSVDISGKRFGKLTVTTNTIQRGRKWHRVLHWVCLCDCGKQHAVSTINLTSGHTKSCGCSKGELITKAKTRHGKTIGKTTTPVYASWSNMHKRCYDPSHNRYQYYGPRGITVCARWFDFVNFLADMGEPPGPRMSLGRVDNNAGYEPWNCVWQTYRQQARNTSRNKLITIGKRTRCLAKWAEIYGRNYGTLHWRISAGWSVERAMQTPERKGNYR